MVQKNVSCNNGRIMLIQNKQTTNRILFMPKLEYGTIDFHIRQ